MTDDVRSRGCRWIAYTLLVVVALVLVQGTALATDSCSKHGSSTTLKRSLKGAATHLLRSIQSGDAGATMKAVSARGVGIGVDQPQLARTAIEEQLRTRTGVYCLLFSTACMQSDTKAEWLTDRVLSKFHTSLSDWLRDAAPYKMETFLLTESGICGGLVRITSRAPKSGPTSLELEFTFEHEKWKLINIPYSLGE